MKVSIPAIELSPFDNLPLGGFFKKEDGFGLCVSLDGKHRVAIALTPSGPLLRRGALPEHVIYFPTATAHVDAKSGVLIKDGEPARGALIKANGRIYIEVSDSGSQGFLTFDVMSGLRENSPAEIGLAFTRWKVGCDTGNGEFADLFDTAG